MGVSMMGVAVLSGWRGWVRRESSCIAPVGAGTIGFGAGVVAGTGAGAGAGVVELGASAEREGAWAAVSAEVCLFEGFTFHASSSKPLAVVPVADAGVMTGGAGDLASVALDPVACDVKAFGSITSLVCEFGLGRPLVVLFLSVPPGPEKRPPDSSSPFFFRAYLLSKNLIILMISPSLMPILRSMVASTSGKTLSSIESLVKACA